jgi:hypothetical protein
MKRSRLLTPVVLGLALMVGATCSEAKSKHLHVTAHTVQHDVIGDPANPQLGDRIITNVMLVNDQNTPVGTGAGVCTLVSVPPQEMLVECLNTAVLPQGQIIFGGVAPMPTVGATGAFGILGGTDDFDRARGEATLVITAPGVFDSTFDLD